MNWTDYSALSELFWTFDCALVFWAIVKYAGHRLSSTELKSALFAANCELKGRGCKADVRVRHGTTTCLDRSWRTAHAPLSWLVDLAEREQYSDVLHESTGNHSMGLGHALQAGVGQVAHHRGRRWE